MPHFYLAQGRYLLLRATFVILTLILPEVIMSKRLVVFSAIVISAVVLVTYQPGFKVGFFNGWWYLEWVGTMDLPRYIIQFIDPRNVTQGYRPMQGLYVLVQYLLFRFNFDGFYAAQMMFHAANSFLFFLIVGRLSQHRRLAVIAAVIYAVLPVYSLAVFWHAVVDPFSAFFYLLTILLWTLYQETQRSLHWVLTFVAYLGALFSKEVAVFLPVLLFLIERWFYHREPDWRLVIREYVPFLAMYVPFAILELNVQTHGEFVGQFGFSIGPHMLANLMPYLAVLAFPWTTDLPRDMFFYVWLAIVAFVYIGWLLYKRSPSLLFLAIFAVLNIVPLLGFSLEYFNTRYLYTATMVSALVIAILIEAGFQRLGRQRVYAVLAPLGMVLLVVASSGRVANAAGELAEYTRTLRVPFRDISRQHASFPEDTLLYFVYSPHTRVNEFQGLFFVRYGTGVEVDGTDTGHAAELRAHQAAFVYYFDSTGRPIELPVEKDDQTYASAGLPVRYNVPISFDGYEMPRAMAQRGQALVVLLNWSVSAPVNKDYALFVHLIDRNGNIISGYDGPPLRGNSPTSTWRRGQPIHDAVVLPIAPDTPLGENYRLEIGMYDQATMERLTYVDDHGQRTSSVIIERIAVEP